MDSFHSPPPSPRLHGKACWWVDPPLHGVSGIPIQLCPPPTPAGLQVCGEIWSIPMPPFPPISFGLVPRQCYKNALNGVWIVLNKMQLEKPFNCPQFFDFHTYSLISGQQTGISHSLNGNMTYFWRNNQPFPSAPQLSCGRAKAHRLGPCQSLRATTQPDPSPMPAAMCCP